MIFTIIFIIVLLLFIFIKKSDILMPSTIFCIIWTFSIVCAIFLLIGAYHLKYYGIYWILALCFTINIASMRLEKNITALSDRYSDYSYVPKDMPWMFIVFCTLLSFLSVLLNLYENGLSLSVFGDISSLSDASYSITVQRYTNNPSGSGLSQVLGCFTFACGICAGYGIIYADTFRKRLVCFFSIVPVILSTLLTSAKLSLASYFLLFLTGYYVSYINRYHKIPKINSKTFSLILLGIVSVFAIFYITFIFRLHGETSNPTSVVISNLAVYAFGHVQGFDLWFSNNSSDLSKLGLGANSLMSVSSRLGITTKNQGIYSFIPGSCTNIYSPFRGIIEDFGPILGFIAELFLFLFLEWILERLIISRNNSVILQTIAASQIFYFIFVFISCWVYTTYILTFIIFAFFLIFAYRIKFTYKVKFIWKSKLFL